MCTGEGEPTRTVVVDDKGVETIKKGTKMFWVCDLDNKLKKVKQTRLSFQKTTPVKNFKTDDTEQRGGRFRDSDDSFSGATAGLCARGDVTAEGYGR